MDKWINESVWIKYNNNWEEGIVQKISSFTYPSSSSLSSNQDENEEEMKLERKEGTLCWKIELLPTTITTRSIKKIKELIIENNLEIYQRSDYSNISECEDLTHLSLINEPEVLYLLNQRFKRQLNYITIDSILLFINPFQKKDTRENHQMTKLYINQGEIRNLKILPPHIFKTADIAYRRMFVDLFDSNRRENQSIIITGDSGAGKTECSKDLLYYFCQLSPKKSNQKKSSTIDSTTSNTTPVDSDQNNIEDLVLLSYPITESFGNAKTFQNDNSSRFGKYIELYYSSDGCIEGVNIRTYLLEATRVSHQSTNEQNFHIFYEIFSGLSDNDKKQWGFETLDIFHYLNYNNNNDISPNHQNFQDTKSKNKNTNINSNSNSNDNNTRYQILLKSFESFKISSQIQSEIYKVLIGILHIGNIEFTSINNDETNESQMSRDETTQYHLQKSCELMGYTKESLEEIFCYQSTNINGTQSKTHVPITVSIAMRDRLARTLYYSLFKWIVTEVNHILGQKISENIVSFIGILDIFGFENIDQNSFEQICMN